MAQNHISLHHRLNVYTLVIVEVYVIGMYLLVVLFLKGGWTHLGGWPLGDLRGHNLLDRLVISKRRKELRGTADDDVVE